MGRDKEQKTKTNLSKDTQKKNKRQRKSVADGDKMEAFTFIVNDHVSIKEQKVFSVLPKKFLYKEICQLTAMETHLSNKYSLAVGLA